ncbi:hypothetical protein TWF718_004019 [Orbilia javanica]|uniref:Uncharacterized protein n=1 Tax=Orbilia javanica TaxID=47235 RepID=A0AAN8N5L9_9PEZI
MEQLAERIVPTNKGQVRTTSSAVRRGSERVSQDYISEWPNFEANVRAFIGSINVHSPRNRSAPVATIARVSRPSSYMIGQEDGIKGAMMAFIAEPVGKAIKHMSLGGATRAPGQFPFPPEGVDFSGVGFGDPKCIPIRFGLRPDSREMPDMAILRKGDQDPVLLAPIEIKTPWTVDLTQANSKIVEKRRDLGVLIGQLVGYMNATNSKYGVLSTLETTVFVKRDEVTLFRVSAPITSSQTGPSLNECFLYLTGLLATSPTDGGDPPHRFGQASKPGELSKDPSGQGNPKRGSKQDTDVDTA